MHSAFTSYIVDAGSVTPPTRSPEIYLTPNTLLSDFDIAELDKTFPTDQGRGGIIAGTAAVTEDAVDAKELVKLLSLFVLVQIMPPHRFAF